MREFEPLKLQKMFGETSDLPNPVQRRAEIALLTNSASGGESR